MLSLPIIELEKTIVGRYSDLFGNFSSSSLIPVLNWHFQFLVSTYIYR